ncbi:MAG: TRM11 family methyltransferase [Candidatus Sigynarchaeota archaeon]
MHRIFFFTTGENFNTRRHIEPGDEPAFTMLEITSLLKALFPTSEIRPRYTAHRIVEADVPAFNASITRFLRRSVSIWQAGTLDFTWIASSNDVEQAIREFKNAVPGLEEMKQLARGLKGKGNTFAIAQTVHGIPVPKNADLEIKTAIGSVIGAESGLHVDLLVPDVSITTIITTNHDPSRKIRFLISFNCTPFHTRGFKARIAKNRPAFEIGTMNPPLTSLMVNVSHPPWNRPSLLFDPYCGTGGIIIEALARGIASVGVDIDYKCIKGCIANLRYYSSGKKAGFNLLHASTFSLPFREDLTTSRESTITVTDPPYGRLESLKHAPFDKYIEALLRLSRSHAMLCLAIPEVAIDIVTSLVKKAQGMSIVSMQRKREHAGFTRAILLITSD